MSNNRHSKTNEIETLSTDEAKRLLFVAIDTFKRHRQFNRFMVSKPTALRIKGYRFAEMVERLEEFRCSVLGMPNAQLFYQMVAEFTAVPNGVKYYPTAHLFAGGEVTEEFLSRVMNTLVWTFDVYDQTSISDMEIVWFADKIKKAVKVFDSGIERKHKDWYCLVAILCLIKRKGWSDDDLVRKLKIWYRSRVKKVTAEMLLFDLTHGQFDHVTPAEPKPTRRPRTHDLLQKQTWQEEWLKNVGENRIDEKYEED